MNLTRQIEKYLPQQLLELLRDISRQADELGQSVYLVGGVVRDILLGHPSFDLDLVLEGDAIGLAQRIAETNQAKVITHPRFGTAKLSYGDFTLDIATARGEIYTRPGMLPLVTPGTLSDDLSRRDFSINAMAISLDLKCYGELIDAYGGKNDLEHRLIRILHTASFQDDATRILRAIRYEQRLGFKLETQTAKLFNRDIPMLDTISGDRIRHELELIFREECPEFAINRLDELGVLRVISSSLKVDSWMAGKFCEARRLSKPNQLPLLYFCLLVYPLNEGEEDQLLHRLNIPAKLSRAMRDTLLLKTNLSHMDKASMKPSDIYYLLREYDPLAIQANTIASDSLVVRDNLQLFVTKLRFIKPLLSGEELKGLGISPGPEMGSILQSLHRAKLDGEVNTRADEENLALLLKSSKHYTDIE